MSPRQRNHGLRKVCGCRRGNWPKCPHSWYFNFKPKGGPPYRFSLDAELGRHLDTKTDAEHEATTIRAAILAGTFRRSAVAPVVAPPTPETVTLDTFVPIYIERVAKASGKASWKDDAYLLGTVCAHRTADGRRLGEWALHAITEDELEAFHASRIAAGRANSTLNHMVQALKAAFQWAAKKGYLARSPISEDSALKRAIHAKRTRRLAPAEETLLLAAAAGALTRDAGVRLSGLIVAAIETGCRLGELLALRWADVHLERRELAIRGENAKDEQVRILPISARLAAVFEMAQTDPAGRVYPPTASSGSQSGVSTRRGRPACSGRMAGNLNGSPAASSPRPVARPYARSTCTSTI